MPHARTAALALGPVLLLLAGACGPRQEQAREPEPAAPAPAAESPAAAAPAKADGASATAKLAGPQGSPIGGSIQFRETADGVVVTAHLTGVQGDGPRGFHLHEVGNCSAADFSSAGGHFNPTAAPHGGPDAAEHHAGDLGNVEVGADGSAHLERTSKLLTVAPGPNSVVGRAVILHEKADDFTTQPTGNAGGRVACGVVLADGTPEPAPAGAQESTSEPPPVS